VFRVKADDSNYASLMEMFLERSREPIIAQAFLPDVAEGDRRIILIDGEAVGGINRRPLPGETRSNMHVGGKAEPYEMTASDLRICEAIGPELKRRGQVLVGIDVIGDKMTEVNLTSPTGVQELKRFSGVDAAALFWDAVDRRLA
jgi:glutathione synthase